MNADNVQKAAENGCKRDASRAFDSVQKKDGRMGFGGTTREPSLRRRGTEVLVARMTVHGKEFEASHCDTILCLGVLLRP